MNLHTIGCSFTYAGRKGWPDMLANKLTNRGHIIKIINNGHPGAGNTYIGNKAMLDGQRSDLVIIMWSGLTRKEVTVDHTDEVLMNTLSDYKDYVRWTGVNTSYIFSGGIRGSWMWHHLTKEIFDPLYKVSNERSMAQDSLVSMLNTQNYLKQNNIPYIMSSYMNYWTADDIVGELDYGIKKYPDLAYLYNQIDFSKWLFANDKKDCIYELAKSTPDGLEGDGFHPNFNVHEMWADMLLNKIEQDGLIK